MAKLNKKPSAKPVVVSNTEDQEKRNAQARAALTKTDTAINTVSEVVETFSGIDISSGDMKADLAPLWRNFRAKVLPQIEVFANAKAETFYVDCFELVLPIIATMKAYRIPKDEMTLAKIRAEAYAALEYTAESDVTKAEKKRDASDTPHQLEQDVTNAQRGVSRTMSRHLNCAMKAALLNVHGHHTFQISIWDGELEIMVPAGEKNGATYQFNGVEKSRTPDEMALLLPAPEKFINEQFADKLSVKGPDNGDGAKAPSIEDSVTVIDAIVQDWDNAEAEAKDQIATVITGMDSDNLAEVFMTPEAAQNLINATVKMLNDAPTPIREALDLEALTLAI